MISFLKRSKIAYACYNFFQKKKLSYNTIVYKKIGLNKKYYSSVSSKDFNEDHLRKINLTDQENSDLLSSPTFEDLSKHSQQSILDYNKNGFVILNGFLSDDIVNEVNQDIERLKSNGTLSFKYNGKLNQAIKYSEVIKSIGLDKSLNKILKHLFKAPAKLFHSINFIKGSEQDAHSDSIHMTTFPLGGLLGVWIALEDTDENNGPLHYYPGSHTLPYYLNTEYDNEGTRFMIGDKNYDAYEEMINGKIKSLGIEKRVFKAKKGDVLIWHANLIHGGEPQKDPDRTRKSMVFHYFKDGCVCYHEITQRPALLENFSK